jgi:hypothetical protein
VSPARAVDPAEALPMRAEARSRRRSVPSERRSLLRGRAERPQVPDRRQGAAGPRARRRRRAEESPERRRHRVAMGQSASRGPVESQTVRRRCPSTVRRRTATGVWASAAMVAPTGWTRSPVHEPLAHRHRPPLPRHLGPLPRWPRCRGGTRRERPRSTAPARSAAPTPPCARVAGVEEGWWLQLGRARPGAGRSARRRTPPRRGAGAAGQPGSRWRSSHPSTGAAAVQAAMARPPWQPAQASARRPHRPTRTATRRRAPTPTSPSRPRRRAAALPRGQRQ